MNYSKLKVGITGFISAMAFSAILMACEDSKTGNNSTPGAAENNTDTSAAANTATKPVKKSGKASAKMADDDNTVKVEKDKTGVYTRAEVSPSYQGGQSGLENYIMNTIQYPQEAIDNNVEGVVNVQFAVDEKGNVSDISTVGPKLGYGLEEEAVKVVTNMPKWTPGQVKGKNVKVWRTLPINYRLES